MEVSFWASPLPPQSTVATRRLTLAESAGILPPITLGPCQVGGKQELTGKTDIEIEISNQCARLIANAIIYYTSAILSRLLIRYGTSPTLKILDQEDLAGGGRHIHLNGRYM